MVLLHYMETMDLQWDYNGNFSFLPNLFRCGGDFFVDDTMWCTIWQGIDVLGLVIIENSVAFVVLIGAFHRRLVPEVWT
jgi:hypothetical protein